MLVHCMMCRKPFDITDRDPQFRKIAEKLTKYYICSSCNSQTRKEAIASSEIDPNSLDPKGYDKLVK